MDKDSMGEGYEKTKPWHPLYNIVIFTVFGFIYMNGLSNPTIAEAFITVCLKDIHLDNVRIFEQGVQKFVQLNLYTAL